LFRSARYMTFVDQVVDRVHHQGVEVFVVATGVHVNNAGVFHRFVHHARGGIFADMLQPADVHVLQHRVRFRVGRGGVGNTVKTNADTIQRLSFENGVAQQLLEVWLTDPCVHGCVTQSGVEVVFTTQVVVFVQIVNALRCAGTAAAGVGIAGNTFADAKAYFFTLHFINAND